MYLTTYSQCDASGITKAESYFGFVEGMLQMQSSSMVASEELHQNGGRRSFPHGNKIEHGWLRARNYIDKEHGIEVIFRIATIIITVHTDM